MNPYTSAAASARCPTTGATLLRTASNFVQIALPPGRVVTAAVLAGGRPIQYQLDAVAHPVHGLVFGCPVRLDDGGNLRNADMAHQRIADGRVNVHLQRVVPLLGVLCCVTTQAGRPGGPSGERACQLGITVRETVFL